MRDRSFQSVAPSRRAVVVGCGRIGARVAAALSEEGFVVQILDISSVAFDLLPPGMIENRHIIPILGDGTLETDLRRASAQEADVFVALTGTDTRNAMSAQIAKHLLQVPIVICRMNDPTMAEMYNKLEIKAISATMLVTDMVLDATKS